MFFSLLERTGRFGFKWQEDALCRYAAQGVSKSQIESDR